MPAHYKTTDYKKIQEFIDVDPIRFHSKVSKVKKRPLGSVGKHARLSQKYKNIWYLKTVESADDALREVIAQEIFRLFIPNQPKTRLIENTRKNKKNVASKEVDGYRALDAESRSSINANIRNGIYHGLGDILVMALWVNETDLRLPNLCLNTNNQIIKLDGDRCFIKFKTDFNIPRAADRNYHITENDLQRLPYVDDYEPWNWLDLIDQGVRHHATKIIDEEILRHPGVRDEINRALMKIMVMPEQLIEKVIDAVLPDKTATLPYYDELINRRNELRNAAIKNKEFREYMLTSKATGDLEVYLKYLTEFKTIGKNYLELHQYEKNVWMRLRELVAEVIKQNKQVSLNSSQFPGGFFSPGYSDPVQIEECQIKRKRYLNYNRT